MHIAANRAFADGKFGSATQAHVLSDLGDGVGDCFANGDSPGLGGENLLDIGSGIERGIADHFDEALKQIVAGHKVGFGIDLNEDALTRFDSDADEAFGGDAAGFLCRLG